MKSRNHSKRPPLTVLPILSANQPNAERESTSRHRAAGLAKSTRHSYGAPPAGSKQRIVHRPDLRSELSDDSRGDDEEFDPSLEEGDDVPRESSTDEEEEPDNGMVSALLDCFHFDYHQGIIGGLTRRDAPRTNCCRTTGCERP